MKINLQETIKTFFADILQVQSIKIEIPPNADMGDFSYNCVSVAKSIGENPVEYASNLVKEIDPTRHPLISEVKSFGPYVNIYIDKRVLVKNLFEEVDDDYGKLKIGSGQKVLVEFGCPNPMKVFHLGHLKNLITGESLARLLEQVGFEVVRVNYQGDVGMHIAKTIWAIMQDLEEFNLSSTLSLDERVAYLGRAYTRGAEAYENDDTAKVSIGDVNIDIYENKLEVIQIYEIARGWSLAYFETIYQKLDTKYDKMYFESETFARGKEIVQKNLGGVFIVGEGGAIIYDGEEEGLHRRVFLNAKGYPTYEAKEVALAERHFIDYEPSKIYHVVGKEQTEYFKVVIRVIEKIFPEMRGMEEHIIGGFLQLKGGNKMSSRKGNVVSGDRLIIDVESRIRIIMEESGEVDEKILEAVSIASLKYGILRADISQDVVFDLDESVSVSGNSGPYLLYIVARIRSVLREAVLGEIQIPTILHPKEEILIVRLSSYEDVLQDAYHRLDTSIISKYLFHLAQDFNSFYSDCPILKSEDTLKYFRLRLIQIVDQVMTSGLKILGIETVDKM